ncbi:hypothetical protein H0H92_010980 [Tricholoma furcatifolium]|nr:hypothetical protein H0H92_010980 [Tricholoma furcatifolium]
MSSWYSSWYSSWLPGLPSLNISLPSSLQGRFISFVLKKTLGHLVRPGQLDSSQIDSKIGSGFVQINDLELDNECKSSNSMIIKAINSLIPGIPVSLQTGSISSVIVRVPWPNPLSSTLGFSVDSLHLSFVLLPLSSHTHTNPANLADSVASVAESFIHDELSAQEGAALWNSMHADTVTIPPFEDDPSVPGGLTADPFLSIPEEAASDMDPAGVSIFTTLIERLLARFEFDATNISITLVHPENMSITASISHIRYQTDDSSVQSGAPEALQVRGHRRTISVSGFTLSTCNLRSEVQSTAGLRTPTKHSPSPSREIHRPVSPASSSSSLDEEAQFAMSQSLACLPSRHISPSSSVASSMYQSALSTSPPCNDKDGDDTEQERESGMAQATDSHESTSPSNNQSFEHSVGETIMSFGSSPIILHIDTPSPLVPGVESQSHEYHGEEGRIQFTLTIGIFACALQAWQICGLLELANNIPSHSSEKEMGVDSEQPFPELRLSINLRGIVLLLPLPASHQDDLSSASLEEFFKWPLVPPILPHSYARFYIDAVSATISIASENRVSGKKSTKLRSSMPTEILSAIIIGDFSLFYIKGTPHSAVARTFTASPILITDPNILGQYDHQHRHPNADNLEIALPIFGLVDWTAENQLSNGLKLSLWRTKLNRRQASDPQRGEKTTATPAITVKSTVRKTSGNNAEGSSHEVDIRVVPLHFFLDLETILGGDDLSAYLMKAFSGHPVSPNVEPGFDVEDRSETDTAPASPSTWNLQQREAERKRLEKMVIEDLDLGFDYSAKEKVDVAKTVAHQRQKVRIPTVNFWNYRFMARQNKGTRTSRAEITTTFDLIRVQIRCPSPAHFNSRRSGALLVDLHDIGLYTVPYVTKSPRFADGGLKPNDGQPSHSNVHIVGSSFGRILAAYCPANESSAKSILSVGTLESDSVDDFDRAATPLLPRMTLTKSLNSEPEHADVISLRIDIPSVICDISKPMLDSLQYWADDVAQYMGRSFQGSQVEEVESRDTSLIGSRYFAKSRNGSGSGWSAGSERSRSGSVLKVNISEVFVHRAQTLDIRPFIVRSSDLELSIEPPSEGKACISEMALTVQAMDLTIKDMLTSISSQTYISLTSPRSLTLTPKPMVKLRFTSSTLPGTSAKESRVKLALTGFTFNILPNFTWVEDLASFAKSPPGTFESVIPSERTHISLKLFDGAIRIFSPNYPGAIIVQIDDLDFATDVLEKSTDSSFKLSIPALALLAIDDISDELDANGLPSHHGISRWKASGFALIAEIENLSMSVQHAVDLPNTAVSIDRARLKVHLAADSLSAVTAFADDFGSIFRPPEEERQVQVKLDRKPAMVSQGSSGNGLMASVDDTAFRRIPEVGPPPDMIYDDLPTNMDYLDESFGAAAGLRELRDDDLDEFEVDEPQPPDHTDIVTDGTGVVSRVGGETIKLLHPEGIKVVENFFDTIPPHSPSAEYGETTLRIRVDDTDITLFLYDGYDWQKTRKTIEEEVKQMRRRLAKIRQLVATGQVQDPSAEDTSALLFNSIYIGLDRDVDGLEPGAIIAAIDEELKEDLETASQSSWQTLKPAVSGKPQTPSIRVHGKRLARSRNANMEFRLSGLHMEIDHFLPNATLLSRTFGTLRDVEILDHIKTSTWKKFLTELRSDSRGNVRETDSSMVKMELLTVQPVPTVPAKEARFRLKILPLRLYVDQDAVDFLKTFFSFKDPHAVPSTNPSGDEIYFQTAEVFPVDLKLDYKPRHVDYRALREGRTIELMNFFHFDGAEMTLRHITLAGITGWATLGTLLNDLWTPDVKATQLVEVISGVAPIRSMVNVGSGVADLVLLPIAQYKKDGRIVRGLQKGTTAFVKSTAIEAIKLGARLATGTQVILEQAESVLGGQFASPITTEAVTGGDDFTDLENLDIEDPTETISKYAQQPVDVKEGVQSAYRSLRRNLNLAAQTILAVPMEVYERSGNEGPVRSVIRAVPIAVLKPMIGASEAVSQTLLGLHNTLDPDIRHENEAKYKRR